MQKNKHEIERWMPVWRLQPPEKSNIIYSIRKYYAKLIQRPKPQKTSISNVKVISHPITQSIKKKMIASSELILQLLIQQTQIDFWGEDPSGLQRRSGGKNPVQAQICSLCSEQWEIQWRCLSDVTDQKWKIEGKTLPLSVPPTRNSFHELCDGSPIQKRKSRPLQSSTNLLPLHELASCLPFVLCCS